MLEKIIEDLMKIEKCNREIARLKKHEYTKEEIEKMNNIVDEETKQKIINNIMDVVNKIIKEN